MRNEDTEMASASRTPILARRLQRRPAASIMALLAMSESALSRSRPIRLRAGRRRGFSLLALWLTFFVLCLRAARADVHEQVDLSTPRRAAETFADAAGKGDWSRALAVLDLSANAGAPARERGIDAARKLHYVLSRSLSFRLSAISDEPDGDPEDGAETETIAGVRVNGHVVPIVLVKPKNAPRRWVFSKATLASVPELYAARGPSVLENHLPPSFRQETLGLARWQWLGFPLSILAAFLAAHVFVYLASRAAARLAARTQALWDDELVEALRGPGRLFIGVLVFVPLVFVMSLPATLQLFSVRVAGTLGLVAIAWTVIRLIQLGSNVFERRAIAASQGSPAGAAQTRGIQTRVRVLRRVVSVVVAACAGAVILMQFEVVRNVGLSLLASAGVAGIVLGLAAQRTLGSLFAGIQLSITQPIRIGDDVNVENEFGTIEEITLTYVVVKVWDERRLIIPVNRFLEQPFQNLTKVSTAMHGSVMLYADFSLPVDELRAEVNRLLEGNPRWDGRTKAVHVTETRESLVEIRVLVSAATGGQLFELRAELRERLVAWLAQREEGRYLPKKRWDAPGPLQEPQGEIGPGAAVPGGAPKAGLPAR